jgi:hypothetical protein
VFFINKNIKIYSFFNLNEVEDLGAISCCPLYLLRRTPAQKDAAPIRARTSGFKRKFLRLQRYSYNHQKKYFAYQLLQNIKLPYSNIQKTFKDKQYLTLYRTLSHLNIKKEQ